MITLPIKINSTGKLSQFSSYDKLPNQEQLDYLYELIQRMLIDITDQGFIPKDTVLLSELDIALQTIKT